MHYRKRRTLGSGIKNGKTETTGVEFERRTAEQNILIFSFKVLTNEPIILIKVWKGG